MRCSHDEILFIKTLDLQGWMRDSPLESIRALIIVGDRPRSLAS